MSFLAAAVPALVSAGAQFGLSKLFGGSGGGGGGISQSFSPTGISAGGLSSAYGGGNIGVASTPERAGLVGRIGGLFGENADAIASLRSKVAPGISDFRAVRLQEIDDAKRAAVGNLRENLQRRRVLGSSFGQDAITRAESEFAGQRERVAAETFLQELELTQALTEREFGLRRQQFQTGLDELNLQSDVALKLAGAATSQLGENARLEARLNAMEAQGAGKFFGDITKPVANALGKGAGDWFSGRGVETAANTSNQYFAPAPYA